MMIMTSNIPTFQDGEKYLECILKNGDHDFTAIDSPKQISSNVYEIFVICLECGYTSQKYNILENDDLDL